GRLPDTPSPPRSQCGEASTRLAVAGEREGVRGKEVSRSARPLTPSLSPTAAKKHAVRPRFDRGGEGVALSYFSNLADSSRSIRPAPVACLRQVDAVLVSIITTGDLHVAELLPRVRPDGAQPGHTVDHADRQREAVELVLDGQLQGRVDVPPLLV